ncbi:tRNA (adenine-N(1)-)-methyltransferase non-catalytic subunit trm6 [Ophiocordyceps sinensis CO18]|uniref:tRNA (adenine(58)-N(1))-methyltransferase non-catalytic subunit TRM6 n=1 Tax=Ophiocordyceps sinensis (strain Co18 / CGMCC 3.14243) TaxID=911162 RepID=T5A909_OPHSC|nr:tRNA (adenine-N(1)-)-methyltransferase non-catalytic subunit trm6 [Ophiocordyceps sinensis CO18]
MSFRSTVQPNGWIAVRLPNELLRLLQVTPNTTISLGKYGSFPSNLLIERPLNLCYEVQEKREGENFSRLRVVPATELNADQLTETSVDAADGDDVIVPADGEELALVDESGRVVARSNREIIDDSARQTLTTAEIEELKRKGAAAGKELIAKLMLSHTGIDQKTAFSLAKYKLLKEKKYLRRFTVLPVDVTLLAQWVLEDRDAGRILDMRLEMIGLVGCWADVHFGGFPIPGATEPHGGRWLAVDDAGGLLVAVMAERMGILHRDAEEDEDHLDSISGLGTSDAAEDKQMTTAQRNPRKRPRRDDFDDHYALTNTITVVHFNTQPNLSLLRYFDYDASDPNPPFPYHPLFTNLLPISWLQFVNPEEDPVYADKPADATPEELANWKANRRGNYHRKRRRWARTRQIVDGTRAGGFSGLAVASAMDPVSVLRHALPLLAGGSPIAISSPNIEPLTQLADCFAIARRTAWVSSPPPGAEGKTVAELDRWEGTPEFPINPTLVLGATIQTSRATRWQVLPGRTHPFMTARGGPEGYVFTGWRAIPAEGRISARGRFQRRRA